jgi:hypothetical protein
VTRDRRAGYVRAALLALVLPLLVLVGCAADPGSGVATASGPATTGAAPADEGPEPAADRGERALQFAQCMREHGIDMEDPVDGRIEIRGRPGDEQELGEAQEACQEFAPGGDGDGRPDPAMVEQMRVFAQCMRDNGVPDFPDPDPDGGVRIQRGQGSGVDEEAFQAAQEACRDRLPAPPGGGGS